jgi:hypothetical protein
MQYVKTSSIRQQLIEEVLQAVILSVFHQVSADQGFQIIQHLVNLPP